MIRTIPSPLRGRETVRPPQQLWKLSFSPLYFYHFLQAVPAKDVDRFGGPHGLAAAGANQFPGAAGFRRWRRGDASRYPCPGPPRCKAVSPSHVDVEEFIRNAGGVDIESPTLTKRERVQFAKEQVVSTFKKVFPYILVGVGIGAVIHNWIPESWIEAVLGGNNPFGVVLATLVGVPMYADIFGTIPVAEALLYKGAQLGTILSFMMAVTTLSLPSLIMLRKAVKPKLLALFISICTIGIIIVGYLFNAFQFLLI